MKIILAIFTEKHKILINIKNIILMKTLKELIKNVSYAEVLNYISKHYRYAMGGTKTLNIDNKQVLFLDQKDIYRGRGNKYNTSIRYDEQIYSITSEQLEEYKKLIGKKKYDEQKNISLINKEFKQKQKRIFEAEKKGVYSVYNNIIELSESEQEIKNFNPSKLAKTLNISVSDAELLKSRGKTYVFAQKLDNSEIIELYHADLNNNSLNIHVSKPTEERIKEFKENHSNWLNALYSHLLGQTENKNHFVC